MFSVLQFFVACVFFVAYSSTDTFNCEVGLHAVNEGPTDTTEDSTELLHYNYM